MKRAPRAKLVGLDNRIKSASSTKRRLAEDLLDSDASAQDILDAMGDLVRYTHQIRVKFYVSEVERIIRDMQAQGLELDLGASRNCWSGSGYKGISTRWRDPGSGQVFEVQFHTPKSYRAAKKMRPTFDSLRAFSVNPAAMAKLKAKSDSVFASVRIPTGAERIRGLTE